MTAKFSSNSNVSLILLIGLVCCLLTGCPKKEPNYTITGDITFDGKPVSNGEIFLRPMAGNTGPGGFALINKGKYTAPLGLGALGGKYKFTIHGFGSGNSPGEDIDLFSPFEVEVDIPAADFVFDVEVPNK